MKWFDCRLVVVNGVGSHLEESDIGLKNGMGVKPIK